MKKIFLLLIAIMLVFLALTGCKGDEPTHEHNYNHSVVFTDPTDKSEGYTTYKCECGESYVSTGAKATEGLTYTLNADNTYTVTGLTDSYDKTIVIPSHYEGLPVVAIGDNAFRDLPIVKVVIPSTVTKIGHLALCASLNFEDVEVNPANPGFTAIDGVLYSKDTKTIVQYPIGRENTSFEIPSHVTAIGNGAFAKATELTSVTIPAGVTSIGVEAFKDCDKITEFKLPEALTAIDSGAFASCTALKTVNVPDSVTTIGDGAFCYCENLTAINIPNGITTIGEDTFAYCYKLTSVVIPDTVTSIGINAFNYCNGLVSVHMSASVESIGDYAFTNCKSLTSISLPDRLTYLGEWAFSWCESLKSANVPASVGVISSKLFYMCRSLEAIEIPEGITSIGDMAFYECYKIKSIFIPESVTCIEEKAFARCLGLEAIRVSVTNLYYASGNNNKALYTHDGETLVQYALGNDAAGFTIAACVEKISAGAFNGAEKLLEIYFEKSSGWTVGNKEFSGEELSDLKKAAYYLTDYYVSSDWVRE